MCDRAGGSIGSELSRQLSKLLPKRLILIDIEHNLYRLNQQFLNKIRYTSHSWR